MTSLWYFLTSSSLNLYIEVKELIIFIIHYSKEEKNYIKYKTNITYLIK